MADNLFGRFQRANIEAKELQSLLEQINSQIDKTSFDPKQSIKNAANDLKEIVSLSQQFADYQKSIALGGMKNAKMSADDLQNLAKKVTLQKQYFKNRKQEFNEALKNRQKQITQQMRSSNLTEQELNKLNRKQAALDVAKSKATELNKRYQNSYKTVGGLEKQIKKAAAAARGIERGEKAMAAMNKLIEAVPLTSWLNPLTAISNIINFIYQTIVEVDKATGVAAKSLNRSYQEVASMREEMAEVAKSTSTIYDNSRDMLEVFTAINEDLGTSLNFTRGMTKSQKEGVAFLGMMYKYAGLTLDEVKGLQKFSYFQGRDVKQMSGEMMAQYKITGLRYKVALNEKNVLRDIQTTSAYFKVNIEGGAVGLAKALATTKALATSLDDVNSTAKGLLNFEQSIEKELSAELLLGKQLNGEYMRTLAFNKDYTALAEEIRNTIGSTSEEFERNAIQSQALADYLGMSVEKMTEIAYNSEAAQNASAGTVDIEQQKLNALNSQTELVQQQLELQQQQASVAETFDAQLQNLIDTQLPGIYSLLDMVRGIIIDVGGYIKNIIDNFDIIKSVISIIGGLIVGKIVFGIMNTITKIGLQLIAQRQMNRATERQNSLLAEQTKLLGSIAGIKEAELGATTASVLAEKNKGTSISQNIGKQNSLTAGAIGEAGAKSTAAIASSFGAMIPVIAGGIATIFTAMAIFDSMDDGVIGPGYGSRILLTPQGGIAFNNKDTIVAGTKLNKGNDVISAPEGSINLGGGGGSPQLLEEIMKMNKNIEALANRPIDITTNIDGEPLVEIKGRYPNEDALTTAKDSFKIS